ncbi:MAG: ABC transporter ATP-binding protein [Proteobacteria bacterium]|nr:ABC transporter ATP-binding protein [Pseudomonadota bacterium]MBI3498493.1 ABC transporter ATP-binding protein [Pseudomonadota bacterium]
MSSEPIVRAQHLGKVYRLYDRPQDRLLEALSFGRRRLHRDFHALEDVSFEVARGETIGIIGRNGSGKSTLLQMVAGTLNPSAGSVAIKGRVAALLELGAGFNPEFTGRENVLINGMLLGLSREEVLARFDSIRAFADIDEFLDQPVKTYSSGMYTRLAFAVVAHVDADLLIIDEVLAVGDAFFQQKCMRFLRSFQERGAILFVSHDTAAVTALCGRALWLDRGRLRAEGSAEAVSKAYLDAFLLGDRVESRVGEGAPGTVPDERRRRDQRLDLVNASRWRNDIEIVALDAPGDGRGQGGATIRSVELQDEAERPLAWLVGGEIVRLVLEGEAHRHIDGAILGFYFKDRFGQFLFGDNTLLKTAERPLVLEAGEACRAVFTFRLPLLPPGDYAVSAAFAEGHRIEEHAQQHWLHEALVLKVHSSSVHRGLIGLPMIDIALERGSVAGKAGAVAPG